MNHGDTGDDCREREEQVTRLVREGVKPEGVKDRLGLAADKLAGNVPLGVDARNKTARKVIGGAGELLTVVKLGLFGGLLVIFGSLFVIVGFSGGFSWNATGLGVVLLALGAWSLRAGCHAWRTFRAISKA